MQRSARDGWLLPGYAAYGFFFFLSFSRWRCARLAWALAQAGVQ